MNKRYLKYVEIVAGSSIIFIFAGYFCGYWILNSFMQSMFHLPFTATLHIPPANVIQIGYIFIFGFTLTVMLSWKITQESYISDLYPLIGGVLGLALVKSIHSGFKIYKYYLPELLIKGIIFLSLTILAISIILLLKKFKLRIKRLSKRKINFDTYFIIGLIASLALPLFSQLKGVTILSSNDPYLLMTSFYSEMLYVIILIYVVTSSARKYLLSKQGSKNELMVIFQLIFFYLVIVYSFSSVIGKGLAENYRKSNSGIFPLANISLNKEIKMNNKSTLSLNNVGFISKDNSSYYIFTLNPSRLVILEESNVNDIQFQEVKK